MHIRREAIENDYRGNKVLENIVGNLILKI